MSGHSRRTVLKGMASAAALAGGALAGLKPAFAAREKELNILC